jgi:hypothetical protein
VSKLAVTVLLTVLVTGIGCYIFVGGQSVKQKTLDGHEKLKSTVRTWDYASN